jgi:uncharacterized protein involved in exopolysaccharide biosynthesis
MTETPQLPEDDDISLLDLLLIIAQNLRLLIIGPIVVGLVALAGASHWPSTYESSFTVYSPKKLIEPQQISSLAVAVQTLNVAAKTLKTAGQAELGQSLLAGAASSNIPRNTNMVNVKVQAVTAQAAHDMAQALLAATLQASRPQGDVLAELEQNLKKDQTALDNARQLEQRINSNIQQNGSSRADMVQSYAALLPIIATLSSRIDQHRARLEGLTQVDVIAQPQVPGRPAKPNKGLLVLLASLATGFALLLFVFMRQALRNASQDSESAQKLSAIQAAWRKALGR